MNTCRYIKTEDGSCYVFDGDFDQYLLDIGVSAEHIKRMKTKILEPSRDEYYGEYNIDPASTVMGLVPLKKVVGTNRSTIGKSVYENVRRMKTDERRPDKFIRCFNYLNEMSLEELRSSYEELPEPVNMIYYKDEDAYYLVSDGNHRTLTAMILGASKILANINVAKCDEEKREKYFVNQKFYKKYSISDIVIRNPEQYSIIICFNGKKYAVHGFERKKTRESCFEIIKRLSEELDKDIQYRNILCPLPKAIRKILIRLFNKRYKRIGFYPDIADVEPILEDKHRPDEFVKLYEM